MNEQKPQSPIYIGFIIAIIIIIIGGYYLLPKDDIEIKDTNTITNNATTTSDTIVTSTSTSTSTNTSTVTNIENNIKKDIQEIGFMDGSAKNEFLGKARAFLFPIKWEEPFGMVMLEAMACGTPVIAYNRGSVPEIVKDGVTGFIVNPPKTDLQDQSDKEWIIKKRGIEGLVEAVGRRK